MKKKTKKILGIIFGVAVVTASAGIIARLAINNSADYVKGSAEVLAVGNFGTNDKTYDENKKDFYRTKKLDDANHNIYYTASFYGFDSLKALNDADGGLGTFAGSTDEVYTTYLTNGGSNVKKVELETNYDGYIDTVAISGITCSKEGKAKVSVWVGATYFGTKELGTTSQAFTFDKKWMYTGVLKIVITNSDKDNVLTLSTIKVEINNL